MSPTFSFTSEGPDTSLKPHHNLSEYRILTFSHVVTLLGQGLYVHRLDPRNLDLHFTELSPLLPPWEASQSISIVMQPTRAVLHLKVKVTPPHKPPSHLTPGALKVPQPAQSIVICSGKKAFTIEIRFKVLWSPHQSQLFLPGSAVVPLSFQ